MTTNKEKEAFSFRLNLVLDRLGAPPKHKGRQNFVAAMFNVSQKGARNWVEAGAIPHREKQADIVKAFKDLGVTGEWLFYGNPDYAPGWFDASQFSTEKKVILPFFTNESSIANNSSYSKLSRGENIPKNISNNFEQGDENVLLRMIIQHHKISDPNLITILQNIMESNNIPDKALGDMLMRSIKSYIAHVQVASEQTDEKTDNNHHA